MKISQISASLVDHMGTDLSVVNAARVSFHKESEWEQVDEGNEFDGPSLALSQRDVKLINYLAKHKHFSPFNHTFLTFRVKAPIFVARQLQKHRYMPWNEVSRRYVDDEPEFYFPDVWRGRATNAKQGSDGVVTHVTHTDPNTHETWTPEIPDSFSLHTDQCLSFYQDLIAAGVAPEQARMVLPQNTMTEWIWSGTLGAYCDMLRLRLDEHTQYESRLVAQQIQGQIAPLFPVSMKALLEN